MSEYIPLAVFIGLVVGAALFGGQWGANEWYRALRKPWFTPPDIVFPIAWSVLYLMIAVAGWYAWKAEGEGRLPALVFWGSQLVLNAVWSYIFFGRREMGFALVIIVAMALFILAFIIAAWPLDPRASLLFVPYLIWVSFAAFLNYTILRMNPA